MSSNETVVKIDNLTKIYKLYDAPIDRLKEALHFGGKKYHKDFYALNDISFAIKKGECVGVIGKNGSGKSTLLKIITGVLTPTHGNVQVNGRVSALLELGAGFNPEYTGLENIYFQGTIMGYEREEVDAKIDQILAFADIGEFIHQPVKNYSSGMFARLAFAVAINVEPDILIVDEALSVGDMFFQAKSMTMMKKLIENDNTTVLFVSHDIASIKALCSSAILLENGKIRQIGDVDSVTEEYFATKFAKKPTYDPLTITESAITSDFTNSMAAQYNTEEFNKISNFQRIRNHKASFTNAVLLDEAGNVIKQAVFGQTVTLRSFVHVNENIHNLSFGFHIRDRNGVEILYDDTVLQGITSFQVATNESYSVDWTFKINLRQNDYNVALVCSIPINLEVADVDMCDFVPIALQFSIAVSQHKLYAALHANSTLNITKLESA